MSAEKELQESQWNGVVIEDADEESPNNEPERAVLLHNEVAEQFRAQWLEIQTLFVDNPTTSVKEAGELVIQVLEKITDTFSEKQVTLEDASKPGDQISTEDLRITLKRYRSFFNRLLPLDY